MKRFLLVFVLVIAAAAGGAAVYVFYWLPKSQPDAQNSQNSVVQIVRQLRQADYEGNQQGMKQSFDDLSRFGSVRDPAVASRVHYWRGFAMWRRAINGLNDNVDPGEIQQDLQQARDELNESLKDDPNYIESKIAMISVLGNMMFLHHDDQAKIRELVQESAPFVQAAQERGRDNPRFLWVMGPILFLTAPEHGGGQDKAIALYERGLAAARIAVDTSATDPLEPTWGEPELLMSLAWSNLNKTTPDLDQAEKNARSALELVPDWHYVNDILLPQITKAKAGGN